MKSNFIAELLNTSKPTLIKKAKEINLDLKKTKSGENIFTWDDAAKLHQYISNNKIRKSVISICQNKGGVGKTTSTINLGYLFSCIGKTLLIDIDAQANLSQVFNIYKSKNELSLKDVLEDSEKITNAIEKISDNLHILPNTTSFDLWKKQAITKRSPQYLLQKALKPIKSDYDFILIDCPPSVDLSFELALYSSNYALIILDGHPFSLEGLENILSEIQRIIDDDVTGLLDLKILGVLFTRYKETLITKQIIENANQNFDVFQTRIRENIQIPESQATKEPIFTYNEMCNGSIDYFKLWLEVLERINK
ncbi:MAG: ParA family protein [Candidatus Sericytochromatia bacterium]